MVQASPVKFYFAKYFLLGFSLLQWLVAVTIYMQFNDSNKHMFAGLFFLAIGLIFLYLFFLVNDKVRRVAIGKNKIVVMEGGRNVRFAWPDVKSLKIVPFFNLYKLKLKGKKSSIFFFPSKTIDPAFGLLSRDTSRMGEIVEKRKKDFNIK